MSLLHVTWEFAIKTLLVSKMFTASVDLQITFIFAIFWFSALSSGFLIYEAKVMECGGWLWLSSV